ncbi:uncharacterized protein DUF1569 [Mucilaginibacter yixingensis]|uniref:Uncharacterized protein DUF1569 n=1 Tax=Mucilaginibacter yixingensis TaxID=1295612 RepID=A0A2T5J8Q4_9SPHI|nr:DUF1569 domain-containing protein [Mucilaginibacter yixingensis]PTQ95835.1 uncharacterized protein DUF1569 [Mucilaginibacter yixingensis]
MKTILEPQTAREVIDRINQLNEDSQPLWGKMSVYQMLRHCAMWEEMLLERRIYKQAFIGKLFGRTALKGMLSDKPMKQNMPTVPSFRITDEGDVEAEKQRWITLIGEHEHRANTGFMHPFFGKLTADEAGRLAYKHVDHHLRQFGV